MPVTQPSAFGALLRHHRLAAGLTQQELAERARVSARAISDLERAPSRQPRHDTLILLLAALPVTAQDRRMLVEAAGCQDPPIDCGSAEGTSTAKDAGYSPLEGHGDEVSAKVRHHVEDGPVLHLHLLGDFRLVYRGVPALSVNTARLQSLLAYLVIHRDAPQPRPYLAYLFWPDANEAQARTNLRQLLHQLRQALPEAERFLYADAATLCWPNDASCRLDVAEFEHALAQAAAAEQRHDREAQRTALVEAVGLYRADLLPGCYDDWIAPERERLRNRYLEALASLVRLLEAQRDYGAAIRHAQAWKRHDPLAEEAYRVLMRLLALTDDRAGAVRLYQTCATLLRRELGVEPSAATREVYERLVRTEAPLLADVSERPTATLLALVGRRREWEQLQAAWQQAEGGGPRFVFVSGEAGIGKSRLAEELLAWASRQGVVVARARSYAAEGQLSLAPVTAWLRSEGIRPHLARLDAVWLTELVRLLPELSAERRDLPPPGAVTDYGQRQRFFEALARAILCAPQPLALLLDDLQWCDQETLEWLHFLLRFDPLARLLVVGTARVEEMASHQPLQSFLLHVGNLGGIAEIALQSLDAADTARLAAQVMGHELDADAALHLHHETEGVPLFVVETARAGLAYSRAATFGRDTPPVGERPPLPPRVYGVIAGRLAHLSAPARALVGLAAVIGRAFTLDLLLGAGNSDEESAVRALDELCARRIVRELGVNGYDFTHDKLREVAYAETGAAQRRLFHRRIAQALESAHPTDLDTVSGQVATHYEGAGLFAQAIPYYKRAAAVARKIFANDEAIALLSRGLALLTQVPVGPERDAWELDLLLALQLVVRLTKGWAAPELEPMLERARVLCDTAGDDVQRWVMLHGLQSVYLVQARLNAVCGMAEEVDNLFQRAFGAVPPGFFGVQAAGALLHLSHIRQADEHFAAMAAGYGVDQWRRLEEEQGLNHGVLAWAWRAHALWCLGHPQSALDCGHEAVRIARDLARPFDQALAAAYLAMLAQFCMDDEAARARAEESLALADDNNAPYYHAVSAILVDYTRAWENPDAEHIAQLRAAIAAFTATGARLRLPYYLSLLARVLGKAGRVGDGLVVIDEALAASCAHSERWWDAELHRIRGELLLAQGAEAYDVEAALLQALEIARSQEARSLELRSATALARFWEAQGSPRRAEGRALLADLYSWFEVGHDTPDLRAAQRVLALPP
jgi:DNA-binding SARP family transcriptional activator